MTGNGKRTKKATRQKLPQVAILLESSHEISRGMTVSDYRRPGRR